MSWGQRPAASSVACPVVGQCSSNFANRQQQHDRVSLHDCDSVVMPLQLPQSETHNNTPAVAVCLGAHPPNLHRLPICTRRRRWSKSARGTGRRRW